MQHRPPRNRNLLNYAVDVAIFLAFLVAMAPHLSGIPVHEWLSIAFGAVIIVHLLLHWSWIVEITRRLFGKVQWNARINYVLNAALFIDMTIAMFTGFMISEAALPVFGIATTRGGVWEELHHVSANGSMVLVGLHVALHWQWIVNSTKRFVLRRPRTHSVSPRPEAASIQQES
jgi:hypothetical protein